MTKQPPSAVVLYLIASDLDEIRDDEADMSEWTYSGTFAGLSVEVNEEVRHI